MDQQLESMKQQNTLEQIDAKGMTQAGVAVIRQGIKAHLDDAQSVVNSMQNPMQGMMTQGEAA